MLRKLPGFPLAILILFPTLLVCFSACSSLENEENERKIELLLQEIAELESTIESLEEDLSDQSGPIKADKEDMVALMGKLDEIEGKLDQMGDQKIMSDEQLAETIDELIIKFGASDVNTDEIIVDPSKRAEYQVLNTNEELNHLDLKRNKAGYYPSVGAFASFQQSLQRSNLFDGEQTGFLPTGLLGFNIAVPIYDGGEKSAKIQKVKLNLEKIGLQKTEFTRAMTLQVRNSQVALNNAKRNFENRKKALDMTRSIFDRTKIKFREGVGSSVEVTQAESALYQAQAEYISALYDVLESKVDLDIALGEL